MESVCHITRRTSLPWLFVAGLAIAHLPGSQAIAQVVGDGPLFDPTASVLAPSHESAVETFPAPPLSTVPETHPAGHVASPADWGCPPPPTLVPRSYFLPSLGRHGVAAPVAPGVESVHSPPLLEGGRLAPLMVGGSCRRLPPVQCIPQHAPPVTDCRADLSQHDTSDFSDDPFYDHVPYDVCAEQGIYGDKYQGPVQRPWLELGFPLYPTGEIPPPLNLLGVTNPSQPKFYLYGDYRAGLASNNAGTSTNVLAHRLNLEWDLWLTATERFHMFTGPFQRGGNFMRLEFDTSDVTFQEELDFFNNDTDTFFFEGDLGQIVGGLTGQYAAFDMPIAVGLIPLLFQNGIWLEDQFVGAAATIPAQNSAWLDWSNYDVTFFCGFDEVTSPAFGVADPGANLFGVTTFIERRGGYLEVGYAYVDDIGTAAGSYHNLGVSYTRRYLNLVSNSVRMIVNAGQQGFESTRTADGLLVIMENSFLTPLPYNVIPYCNLWAGFNNPQSAARAGAAGGVLRNTGILFESDNLTGFPTLDATANDTFGAALGVDLLSHDFSQQLILEAAFLHAFDSALGRNAPGDQYGLGARYQIPISNATLLRFDAMVGWLENSRDVAGARAEYRWKF